MKKIVSVLLLALVPVLTLSYCGKSGGNSGLALLLAGGGSGTNDTSGLFSKIVAGTTEDTFEGRMFTTSIRVHVMQVYLSTELQASGVIKSLTLYYQSPVTGLITCPNLVIKMGHTDVSVLNATYASNYERGQGSLVTVYDGPVTLAAGDSVTIELDEPFNYNGTDNLIVDIVRNGGCGANAPLSAHTTASARNANDTYPPTESEATRAVAPRVEEYVAKVRFNFAGGDSTMKCNENAAAVNLFVNYATMAQILFDKDRVSGSGPVTGLGFALKTNSPGTDEVYTLTVSMWHAAGTGLTGGGTWTDNFKSGASTLVAENATFTIPANTPAGTYVWLPLNGAFGYNGTDGLVVDIETAAGGTDDQPLQADINGTSTSLIGTADAPEASAGPVRYSVKFRFKGGTADFIPSSSATYNYPFYNKVDPTPESQMQMLYFAGEMGINGTITGIGFRLDNISETAAYDNLKVVIGQTADMTLGSASFSGNMDGEQTLYNASFSISEGLKKGDWVDISLGSGIVCDPTKNLVVHLISSGGTAYNMIKFSGNTALYPSRYGYVNNTTSDTPTEVTSGVPFMRFTVK